MFIISQILKIWYSLFFIFWKIVFKVKLTNYWDASSMIGVWFRNLKTRNSNPPSSNLKKKKKTSSLSSTSTTGMLLQTLTMVCAFFTQSSFSCSYFLFWFKLELRYVCFDLKKKIDFVLKISTGLFFLREFKKNLKLFLFVYYPWNFI